MSVFLAACGAIALKRDWNEASGHTTDDNRRAEAASLKHRGGRKSSLGVEKEELAMFKRHLVKLRSELGTSRNVHVGANLWKTILFRIWRHGLQRLPAHATEGQPTRVVYVTAITNA